MCAREKGSKGGVRQADKQTTRGQTTTATTAKATTSQSFWRVTSNIRIGRNVVPWQMANCIIMRVSAICTATTTRTTRTTTATATWAKRSRKTKCNQIGKNNKQFLSAASSGFRIGIWIGIGIGNFRLASVSVSRPDGRLEMWEWLAGQGGDGSFAGITFRFVQKLIEFHKLFRLRRYLCLPISLSFPSSCLCRSMHCSPSIYCSLALFAASLFQMLIWIFIRF